MIKKLKSTTSQACATINKLFETPNFFKRLCNYSNNDIEEVIKNISKIINYYLSTNDIIYNYKIEELLFIANNTETVSNILIHPTNEYHERKYRFQGLNATSILEDSNALELKALEQSVSFITHTNYFFCAEITSDINEAINLSFESPNIVYKSILKQPLGKELPMVVGTDEKSYYSSILEIRLKNIDSLERKTKAKKTKRMMKHYIGKDSLLVIFPTQTKHYTIPSKDITDKETGIYIPPKYLSYIRIPSKYKLLSLCAENKQTRNGELLNITNGTPYQLEQPPKREDYHLYYSRYEKVSVTDIFSYTNEEFTGDISYDIDLIYGSLDTNKSREKASSDPYKNIDFIKRKEDIHVRLTKDGYHIRNGRHRILYLKYFYVTNYTQFKEEGKLDKLKELVTIPMSIERTIETPITNEYLTKIKKLNPRVTYFKTNINNEDEELMIIFNDSVYIIKNSEELINLYNLLSQDIKDNKYFIGTNSSTNNLNYEELFDYLIITLEEKIYTMSLTDIINFIITEGFYINDQYCITNNLNYFFLYFEYCDLQHTIQLRRLSNKPITIIEDTKIKVKKQEIGKLIMEFISKHPDLIYLEWHDLYCILKEIDTFKDYDEAFLESSANQEGYQKQKILQLFSHEKNAKRFFM